MPAWALLSSLLMLFAAVFRNAIFKICFIKKHFVYCFLFAVFIFTDGIRAHTCCFYCKCSHVLPPRFLRLNSSGEALSILFSYQRALPFSFEWSIIGHSDRKQGT